MELSEILMNNALAIIDRSIYESEVKLVIDVQSIVNNRHFQDRFLANHTIHELNSAVSTANWVLNQIIVTLA